MFSQELLQKPDFKNNTCVQIRNSKQKHFPTLTFTQFSQFFYKARLFRLHDSNLPERDIEQNFHDISHRHKCIIVFYLFYAGTAEFIYSYLKTGQPKMICVIL